jgi:hypothetical protein
MGPLQLERLEREVGAVGEGGGGHRVVEKRKKSDEARRENH